ncbi:hypothetical protein AAVH_04026 [Aphelenchoides avenae]|nr:hypothetical protein AAVH_04026 [Aphelenchus avenae]
MTVASSDLINFIGSQADLRKVKIETQDDFMKTQPSTSKASAPNASPQSEYGASGAANAATNARKPRNNKSTSVSSANASSSGKSNARRGRNTASNKMTAPKTVGESAAVSRFKKPAEKSVDSSSNTNDVETSAQPAPPSDVASVKNARKGSRMVGYAYEPVLPAVETPLPPKRNRKRKSDEDVYVIVDDGEPIDSTKTVREDATDEDALDGSVGIGQDALQGTSVGAVGQRSRNFSGVAAVNRLHFDNNGSSDSEAEPELGLGIPSS